MNSQVKKLSDLDGEGVNRYLSELWKKQLKLDEVNPEDDFLNLGAKSIDMFRMLTQIEDDFDCEIDFDDFFEDTRMSVLAHLLLLHAES